jgi:hypothetical protein
MRSIACVSMTTIDVTSANNLCTTNYVWTIHG